MPPTDYKTEDIIRLFNHCFLQVEQTQLVLGGDEPLYLPTMAEHTSYKPCEYHRIIFAHGYFSSALHEISHWCIAGKNRRLLVDYGYWYEPDGRGVSTQAEFAAVESRPQAIEWVLSKSCQKPFHVSLDNLDLELNDFGDFKQAIYKQLVDLKKYGLPPRAAKLQQQLADYYGIVQPWQSLSFSIAELN